MSLLDKEDWPSTGDLLIVGIMFIILFGATLISEYFLRIFYNSKLTFAEAPSLILGLLTSSISIGAFALVYLAFENVFMSKKGLEKKLDSGTEEEYSDLEKFVLDLSEQIGEFVGQAIENTTRVVHQILPTVLAFLIFSKLVLISSELSYLSFIPEEELKQGIIQAIVSLFYLVSFMMIITKDMKEKPKIFPKGDKGKS